MPACGFPSNAEARPVESTVSSVSAEGEIVMFLAIMKTAKAITRKKLKATPSSIKASYETSILCGRRLLGPGYVGKG
jgi:hypothetical protein